MKLLTTSMAAVFLMPVTLWGAGAAKGGAVERMELHQRLAEGKDGELSNRLQALVAESDNVQDRSTRRCINMALDLRTAARKRVSDGVQVIAAMHSDSRVEEELRAYINVASQIFYAAAQDLELVRIQLDRCIVDRA